MMSYRCLVLLLLAFASRITLHAETPHPSAVFEQRIMPIFRSPNPSSCVQCHLSSVDLKDYILPSSRDTFFSLLDQELIDVQRPKESKILHLIAMGESDSDSMARRIHANNRKLEYDAFAAWIEACCNDQTFLRSKPDSPKTLVGPASSERVIKHTRKDRVLDSFTRNVWSQRMRCFPCHTPSELNEDNPLHTKPIERYESFVAKYGTRMAIFKDTPEKTLQSLVISSRKRSEDKWVLVDTERPLQSLLLLKPTAKLPPKNANGGFEKPSSIPPVSHMGGIKMHQDDQSYKAIASWLIDYSNSVSGTYANGSPLPDDNWFPTQHVMRLKGIPDDWPVLSTVQIYIHRWNTTQGDWSDEPVAFTQGKVTPRKMVNGPLFLISTTAERESLHLEDNTLAPGKVQLRVYLDRKAEIRSQPTLMLYQEREPDASGTIEAEFGRGYKNATIVDSLTF